VCPCPGCGPAPRDLSASLDCLYMSLSLSVSQSLSLSVSQSLSLSVSQSLSLSVSQSLSLTHSFNSQLPTHPAAPTAVRATAASPECAATLSKARGKLLIPMESFILTWTSTASRCVAACLPVSVCLAGCLAA
jgi:hypothetical protein